MDVCILVDRGGDVGNRMRADWAWTGRDANSPGEWRMSGYF